METSSNRKIDIINAKSSKRIILDVIGENQSYEYTIYDCKGNEKEHKVIAFEKEGPFAFNVPPSGLISLTPTK